MALIHKSFAVVFAGVALSVNARASFFSHYDVTLTSPQPVTNLFLLETDGGSGFRDIWSFNANANATTHMDVFFPSDAPIAASLFIGVTQGLPGDASSDQKHLVLFMDSQAADLSKDIAWGTLFRNTDEDTLIQNLLDATGGGDDDTINGGIIKLDDFAHGDAMTGILGPGGVPRSAWFSMGSSFKAMAFSTGQQIGQGASFETETPEPASLAVLGLGALGIIRKRRKA